jgi:hypothetical protein
LYHHHFLWGNFQDLVKFLICNQFECLHVAGTQYHHYQQPNATQQDVPTDQQQFTAQLNATHQRPQTPQNNQSSQQQYYISPEQQNQSSGNIFEKFSLTQL